MTFRHPKFDFVDAGGLHVAYRESPEPQVLHVEAALLKPAEDVVGMLGLLHAMEGGCGSLSVALAGTSGAKVLSGPAFGNTAPLGDKISWDIEVTAVSARFMRVAVDYLALVSGIHARPTQLSIVGSLPLDDTPASCRTADVVAWLADPDSAVPVNGALPFAYTIKTAASVKAVRLKLVGKQAFTEAQFGAIRGQWMNRWLGPLGIGLNLAGDGPADPGYAKWSHAGVEIVGKLNKLDVRRIPAEAMLRNALAKLHATIAPLEKVEAVLA